MDIKQLKYFMTVAETKNYSHAAKHLFVTQPTLSQSIKKLETELNAPLFSQSGRHLHLTQAGQVLYERGRKLVNYFDQTVAAIQRLHQGEKESIRIGLTSLFAIQFMKEISTFIATHSTIEVVLIQDGSRRLQELLLEGRIDLGLLSFPSLDPSITIEPLTTSTQGYKVSVVMPTTHPLATLDQISLKDLEGCQISSLNEHYMLGEMLPRRCQALGFQPNIVFKHNDWEVILHSLQALEALTILPSEFQNLSQLEDLVWKPLQDKNDFYPIGIAYRQDTVFTPAMEQFLAILKTN